MSAPDKNATGNIGNNTESITDAHKQAEKDINMDLNIADKQKPEEDLDEGELARFEAKEKDL